MEASPFRIKVLVYLCSLLSVCTDMRTVRPSQSFLREGLFLPGYCGVSTLRSLRMSSVLPGQEMYFLLDMLTWLVATR